MDSQYIARQESYDFAMPILLDIFAVSVKIHECKGHLGEVGASNRVFVNRPKKAPFFLAGFDLDKSRATIRVMVGIGPIGRPMEQSPRTHSEVVRVHVFMDRAVDGGLVPSINDAMVESAEVRQFSVVTAYESCLRTS
jgi:hypothetical protein